MGFYCNIYEMKPDIFEIFRTFSRYLENISTYLEKKSGISGNIFTRFFVIFVSEGLSISCNPGKCKELTMRKKGFVEELCKIHNIPQCSELNV